jgi:hypothetical protein
MAAIRDCRRYIRGSKELELMAGRRNITAKGS